MNSQKYLKLIQEQINKHSEQITTNGHIFRPDNAAIHNAKIIETFFAR